MQCPQCSASMRQIDYEGSFVHTCETCGGEFVGGVQLAHIVRVRQEQFSDEQKSAIEDRTPMFGVSAEDAGRRLTCPACNCPMRCVNYGGDSGVIVDRCQTCGGLWLDHDELEQVQVLMERFADEAPHQLQAIAGELEHARRAAAEQTSNTFSGSRFAFINALINRVLDAA